MKASQDVFISEDRQRAVTAGDKSARFLLARKGQEVSQSVAEKYEGAIELLGGTKPAAVEMDIPIIEDREPAPHHRDPKHKRK